MFSVEYFNKTVIVTAYNVRRINFRYQDHLKGLILQAMKQACRQIVLNLAGVRIIDSECYEMFKTIRGITTNIGVKLSIINLDDELIHQVHSSVTEIADCLPDTNDVAEFSLLLT